MTAAPAATAPVVNPLNAPLYRLGDDYSRLLDLIAENGGEVSPEIGAALESSTEQIRAKVESTIRYVRNRTALRDAARAEAKQLLDYADSLDRGIDGIKKYVLDTLVAADIKKVETAVGTIRWQENGRPVITWDGPNEEIPEAFKRTRVVVSLDSDKAWEAQKLKSLPPGFTVVLGKSLRGL